MDLKHVAVEEFRFTLLEGAGSSNATPESDVWNLAASALELMLGSPIFNGAGESSQTGRTPIPSLPQPEAEPLNRLLQRCLDSRKAERPTAAEVKAAAQEAVAVVGGQTRRPRVHTAAKVQENLDKIDRQWPDRMVNALRKTVVLLVLLTSSFAFSFAQVTMDPNDEAVTQKLLDVALKLRNRDSRSWNTAQDELEKRLAQFTLMNELQDRENDCPLVSNQVKTFGVNRIVSELKRGRRVQNTGRELLDGADVRFSYSIYEKGVKMGRTATYTMSGRAGKQVFVVVPYAANQPYSVELVKADGTTIQPTGKDSKGVTYFLVDTDKGPAPGETLTLKLTNKDSKNNASFVIINHNYRDRK